MEIHVQGLPERCGAKPGDVKRLVRRVLTQEKVDCELAVVFVDDRTMSDLNRRYKKRQGSTDVLAFPMQDGKDAEYAGDTLGDIFISVDRAEEQAGRMKHSLSKELLVLVLHGLFHLLGYNHETMLERMTIYKKDLRD
jgi:probable rRNA maturation factor